ncbi:ABC-three component system protein [Hafnia alvei]|uniref:ABC-three component system protein n=1 Tax=Hafnia alvei TaxID=569 RepID=UPI0040464271
MNKPYYHPGPSLPTPEQRLMLMDDQDWEIFIEQCAHQLQKEGNYIQVHRLGGAGDKGRDVCGYSQTFPVIDSWDLYQAKHYEGTLSPSEFAPELAKFLSNVFTNAYTRPLNYFICALRVGPKLLDLVMSPEDFRTWILNEWKKKNGDFGTFKYPINQNLEMFIMSFPFDIIKIKTANDLLDIHSKSDKHWQMFGILPNRELNLDIPDTPSNEEENYVDALLKTYQEVAKEDISIPNEIPAIYKKHFKAQRRLFYSAEGLNRFSRDKLPGAFDELLHQVELGVDSTYSFPHPDGITRLTKVLETANVLQITTNPLHVRLEAGDLQGTCHHLANQERLTWVLGDEDE